MPCYAPLHGWFSRKRTPHGKRAVVFEAREGFADRRVSVPCGQCIGCRLDYRKDWAVRCVHEASLYDENSFITLTYSPGYLPDGGSLVKEHWQEFIRKLRRRFDGRRIRYFCAGEYGDQSGRPHYHALLFGFDFPDKRFHTQRGNHTVFVSETLEEVWAKGLTEIGSVTYQSAGYVAQYMLKKYKGAEDAVTEYYNGRLPEFALMSRKPGIGTGWYEKYKRELLQHDSVIMDGKKVSVPEFYNERLAEEFPKEYAAIKGRRKRSVKYEETSDVRLDVKRQVAAGRVEHFSNRRI